MQLPRKIKDLIYPSRGNLTRLDFYEKGWLSALVPDDEVFGLTRELILQRVYGNLDAPLGLVVDAGAHVGLFSLMAAQHAERVISLEPQRSNFRILELNAEGNSADNITPLNRALWSQSGQVSFASSWHSTGGMIGDGSDAALVDAVSLDDLVEAYGEIGLLKLDVEGAEFAVISRSKSLAQIRRIVGELHFREDADRKGFVADLEAAGFRVEIIPAPSLYRRHHVLRILRNWGQLRGHLRVKVGILLFLLAPVEKPRRPPGSRDMPLFFAERTERAAAIAGRSD